MGLEGCQHVVDAIDTAVRERVPVIGLWHSGGARLAEGVVALDGVGQILAAMVRASGRVPQISVVLGPAAGGAAYGPALTDIVIMSKAGRIFVTGPEVVRSVTVRRGGRAPDDLVTLVTRKAYGGAYVAMNSRSLGATAVFAWPNAEVAEMGVPARPAQAGGGVGGGAGGPGAHGNIPL